VALRDVPREVRDGVEEDVERGGSGGEEGPPPPPVVLAAQLEVVEHDGDLRAGDREDAVDEEEKAEHVVVLPTAHTNTHIPYRVRRREQRGERRVSVGVCGSSGSAAPTLCSGGVTWSIQMLLMMKKSSTKQAPNGSTPPSKHVSSGDRYHG